jgi:hypothetical protein
MSRTYIDVYHWAKCAVEQRDSRGLESAASRRARVRICMADFHSADIISRLREEPESSFTINTSTCLVRLRLDTERRIDNRDAYELRLFRHKTDVLDADI